MYENKSLDVSVGGASLESLLRTLRDVAQEKQQALLRNDIEGLQAATREETAVAESLRRLDGRVEGTTLPAELRALVEEIRAVQETNQLLLRQSLALVAFSLEALMGHSVKTPLYGADMQTRGPRFESWFTRTA